MIKENFVCISKKHLFLFVILLSIVVTSLVLKNTDSSKTNQSRASEKSSGSFIYGGGFALLGEFPYFTALTWKSQIPPHAYCGGTLLTPYYVITAQHCVKQFIIEAQKIRDEKNKVVGVTPTLTPVTFKEIRVYSNLIDQTTMNQYSLASDVEDVVNFSNDVSLLKLKYPIYVSRYPTLIDSKSKAYQIGSTFTVVGFGATTSVSIGNIISGQILSFSNLLKKTNLTIVEGDLWSWFNGEIKARDSMSSVCKGDSGGPALEIKEGYQDTITGVISDLGVTASCGNNANNYVTKIQSLVDKINKYLTPTPTPTKTK